MVNPQMRQHVKWFRDSLPYINAHRDRCFVVHLGGEALLDHNLPNIVGDLALLCSLGVKVVLVHGTRPQLSAELARRGIPERIEQGLRVTDTATLECCKQVAGQLRIELEAAFSTGVLNSPLHGAMVRISSGNFVKAKPLGVIGGIDYQRTGEVRRIHTAMIAEQLDRGAMVLISPLGYSPSGEIFNLDARWLATRVATDLKADKLILFGAEAGVPDASGEPINELQPSDLERLGAGQLDPAVRQRLEAAVHACQNGVARCHLVSYSEDGALLEELFTRDGSGTQVCQESYEQLRGARIEDVNGIINLIRPLEEEGILVRRSRELLETEIDRFVVIIRDSTVIGCAALYPYDHRGELACLVTHPDYRSNERGDLLLQNIERLARRQGLDELFVLTTRSGHWFQERGFNKATPNDLPTEKQRLYNYQRNSIVLTKPLA